jgi:predicted nucleotidyltransferase
VKAAKDSLGSKLDRVILYGSYARGDYTQDSDIDIMIIAHIPTSDRNKEREIIRESLNYIDLEYDMVISLNVADCMTFYKYADDLPFYMNVLKEGVELVAQ